MGSPRKEFIVFQVKFVRNPYQIKDVHKWLVDIINLEAPKIKKLIPRGAQKYYLLTNVKGTAHLDNGSIDKLNKVLEKHITIPSMCWWRDDLSRKLELNHSLKWSYTDILGGQDILNSILFQGLSENRERRENVIRAYLADQYIWDNEVKFKQIDLQQKLIDLYTDVPIRIKKYNNKNPSLKRLFHELRLYQTHLIVPGEYFETEDALDMRAAEFILNPKVQIEIDKMLLEGGPGQGKSTISQYVCQAHRIRLLNKTHDIELLPDMLKNTPVRLPFKIDLRDVAAWVEKRNPYPGFISEEYFTHNWQKSLEAFLVAHIFYHSKLDAFNTTDLAAVSKLSSILLVFDGFDEIANISVREEIIDFITQGINRLSSNSKSLQTLITSRPAAFSTSINFSIDNYPHFELGNVTPEITKEYVEKWIKSRRLHSRDASAIRRLVEEKLEMPHLRDLAKSPMQLAILMSLLNTRGESLPNKRTALYDSYIDLFFNRESEKNTIIRDNRELIIDIHQYLAWVLHSEAEQFQNSGRISIDELRSKLNEYLIKEGHRTDIADKLFDAVKERVCALVSRIQGTFEFEVQPLREYFCAKYLYNTAPYSPAGAERSGTIAERFDALSRNFYWQNVLRFFAGCFSKGELPMLIHKLLELQNDDILKYTNYPRILTSQLLSDYVFTQYPLLLNSVVKIILDGINIVNVLNQDNINFNTEPIVLPTECGREEIVKECFIQLKSFPSNDYASELIEIIVNNNYRTLEIWQSSIDEFENSDLTEWLRYALLLRLLHKIDVNVLLGILNRDQFELKKRLQILITASRFDVIDNNIDIKNVVLSCILDSDLIFNSRKFNEHFISLFSLCFHPYLVSNIFNNDNKGFTFLEFITARDNRFPPQSQKIDSIIDMNVSDLVDQEIQNYFKSIVHILDSDICNWRSSIALWDILIENGRTMFGDKWIFYLTSIVAAGIKAKDDDDNNDVFDDLNNSSVSLCKRVRYARMKSGNIKWWEKQINESTNICFTLLVFFTWSTPKTLNQLIRIVSRKIDLMNSEEISKLIDLFSKVSYLSPFSKVQEKIIVNSLTEHKDITNIVKFLIGLRIGIDRRNKFIYEQLSDNAVTQEILHSKLQYLIGKFFVTPSDEGLLNEITTLYKKVSRYNVYYYYGLRHRNKYSPIPMEIAEKILSNCKDYPRVIASFAENTCRINATNHIHAVGEIANNEKWFD